MNERFLSFPRLAVQVQIFEAISRPACDVIGRLELLSDPFNEFDSDSLLDRFSEAPPHVYLKESYRRAEQLNVVT
ncbi:hypothetical protein J6590_013452 [Homalodisca vitripennis]|nr:hypothetical protein J6590_013452 [Homalodisca vitripennis]